MQNGQQRHDDRHRRSSVSASAAGANQSLADNESDYHTDDDADSPSRHGAGSKRKRPISVSYAQFPSFTLSMPFVSCIVALVPIPSGGHVSAISLPIPTFVPKQPSLSPPVLSTFLVGAGLPCFPVVEVGT